MRGCGPAVGRAKPRTLPQTVPSPHAQSCVPPNRPRRPPPPFPAAGLASGPPPRFPPPPSPQVPRRRPRLLRGRPASRHAAGLGPPPLHLPILSAALPCVSCWGLGGGGSEEGMAASHTHRPPLHILGAAFGLRSSAAFYRGLNLSPALAKFVHESVSPFLKDPRVIFIALEVAAI